MNKRQSVRTKMIAGGVVLALFALAYVAGYWPERGRRVDAEAQLAIALSERAVAEDRLRLAQLLGRVLLLEDTARSQNYGDAATQSSEFFDAARAELSSTSDANVRTALTQVVARRDAVIGALATGSPSVLIALRALQLELRATLGYPVPSS